MFLSFHIQLSYEKTILINVVGIIFACGPPLHGAPAIQLSRNLEKFEL